MLHAVGAIHGRLVHRRRARVIADVLTPWLPERGSVIDVGCGDGAIAAQLAARRPGLRIEGYDVKGRDDAAIPIHRFDGRTLPLADRSVDAVLLVDVLHHCELPSELMKEAVRVSRGPVLVKDHRLGHPGARVLLTAMDWVGNRPHGVVLPYNYWPEARWREAWDKLGLHPSRYRSHLGLYPFPFSLLLDSGLHFAAALERNVEQPVKLRWKP
jgi:SAM-dependent methyltransferase